MCSTLLLNFNFKAIWIYSTLYAEQDLADISINDSSAQSSISSPATSYFSPASSRSARSVIRVFLFCM